MLLEIKDDFDLRKIALSGQCFRVKRFEDGTYRFVTGDSVVYIKEMGDQRFSVSCDMEEWNLVWRKYFDFDRCYSDIFGREYKKHSFVVAAMNYGGGLRILRQDPWEMLVTFIISQRKSIPAIASAVETISEQYGHCIPTELEMLKSFPTPQELGAIRRGTGPPMPMTRFKRFCQVRLTYKACMRKRMTTYLSHCRRSTV